MKIKIILLLICSILFLQSCTGSRTMKTEITAVPSRDQKIGFEETVTSQKKHFISLAPYSKIYMGRRTTFMMSVQNNGQEPINIILDNISVMFEYKNGDLINVNIQSFDNFRDDFKMECRLNELSYLSSVLGGVEGMVGGLLRKSLGQSSVYDSGMSDIDIDDVVFFVEEKRMELETMSTQNQQILEVLPDLVMSPQTIMPGDSYTGIVVCDTSQINPAIEGDFQLAVSVDGEEHRFTFRRAISK